MIRRSQIVFLAMLAALTPLILIRFREAPVSSESIKVSAAPERTRDPETTPENDFAAHVEQLKKKLPSADFSIVVQPPFVVVGDGGADAVKEYSEHTVKWTVDKLKQDYFSKDPPDILD